LEQALTGSEDNQWWKCRGHLRQVESVGEWLRLTLTSTVGDLASDPNTVYDRSPSRVIFSFAALPVLVK